MEVQIASLKTEIRTYQELVTSKLDGVINSIVDDKTAGNDSDEVTNNLDQSILDLSEIDERELEEDGHTHVKEKEATVEDAVEGSTEGGYVENTKKQQTNTEGANNSAISDVDSKEESCCCCGTFVRGMTKINGQIMKLRDDVIQDRHVNSTISEQHQSNNESTDATSEKYEWEKHSSKIAQDTNCTARNVINKMGFSGKGLGKKENGIEEALTAESIGGNITNNLNPETLIFSSSITKGINVNGFNKQYKNRTAKFHRFHGRTAEEIKSYMPVNLKVRPESVVVVASGNGVPTGPKCSIPMQKIVDDVIDSAKICKDYGVKNVYVSSFLPRRSLHFQSRRLEMNKLLKEHCKANGFIFMAHTNIAMKNHLAEDGVHLNADGSTILCKNMLYHLNKMK